KEYVLRKRRHDAVSRREFLDRFAEHRAELLRRLPADPEVAGYEIVAELGRGSLGVVYKARDLKRDRVVALKKILTGRRVAAEHRARFEREVRALARLRHDHVAGVFDSAVDPADGCLYFTMEFFEGSTLEKQLQRRSPSFAEAARLTEQLARAVQHAH